MKKEAKYENRLIGSFNMPKNFFLRWYQFLYLIEKDDSIAKEKLQKPNEIRSATFRKMITKYIADNWHKFNIEEFNKWRYAYETNVNKNKKKD